EKLTNAAIKKFNISLVPVNTILLSFKLTIGRVAISDCDLTTNEAIARFILPDECYLEFSFLMLKLYNYSTLGSTSSIATAVNSKIIKSMKMVMPSLKVLEDFHTITNPLFEKIRFTQKENQRLAALRDTLLPKLMSGEIKL
ncbi:MAG: restriction endonuclease subunit S, partial [Sodaliphilus sp.]|nr:restriction endonuclease subunit S [Sodaliphilus sp.]